jgi:mRNA interferase HicA
MKPAELIRRITADGWVLVWHGKEHDVYRHPTKAGALYIPRHNKDLATGTLNQLLRIAQLKQ